MCRPVDGQAAAVQAWIHVCPTLIIILRKIALAILQIYTPVLIHPEAIEIREMRRNPLTLSSQQQNV
jgi:hypothetical protein